MEKIADTEPGGCFSAKLSQRNSFPCKRFGRDEAGGGGFLNDGVAQCLLQPRGAGDSPTHLSSCAAQLTPPHLYGISLLTMAAI